MVSTITLVETLLKAKETLVHRVNDINDINKTIEDLQSKRNDLMKELKSTSILVEALLKDNELKSSLTNEVLCEFNSLTKSIKCITQDLKQDNV